ncbi:type II toxin-antitoxin system VapC family toxin [Pantoea cypripedii]|uniref:Ribonuclease VapC n=1 Tax=Pantoea cypripedii TaxID=55209 RepID=A0A6B9G479_PANCY|nr:type II toxin-antitoxin system VapC family toxin [Pantoea cypripedii]QGY29037.1 VapC toxin family PIN domain ribonuclease [Pantoea cypripedii]
MRYLLDTNVISELRKAGTPKANPAVIAWAKAIDAEDMFISALTLMEIEKGILKFARKDPLQARHLQRWYQEQVLMEFAWRTFDIDSAICRLCARLHVPDERPATDALIAATAMHHDLILVTRNVRDFEGMGVMLLNPWENAD